MMTPDQLHASQKNQLSQWFDMADKSLDEAEKLFDLQLSACRETLQEMANCCQSACDVRDVTSAFAWQSAVLKPLAEHSAQYGARLMGLASGTGREFSRTFENQWQAMTQQMTGWMGNWPQMGQGGQQPMDYMRDTMKAFDSVWESARQQMAPSSNAVLRPVSATKNHAKGARKSG